MGQTLLGTRRAELTLVDVCLPGQAPETAGVILHDPSSGEFRLRFRRDWEAFAGEEAEVLSLIAADFARKMQEQGAGHWLRQCEDSFSHTLRVSDREPVVVEDLDRAVERLYAQHVKPRVLPFVTHLPLHSARAAAGKFLDNAAVEEEDWIEAPESLRLDPRMFVVRIEGRSMEPRIPDGSLCVFRAGVQGSRTGKILLIERRGVGEAGDQYAVKKYESVKQHDGDQWRHQRIRLISLNPEFESWELEEDPEKFRVIGELVRVL